MNKTKIEWCDYTWNPITGCLNNCFYCYGRKMNERFGKDYKPTLWKDRLEQPLKEQKPSRIFVCSIADLFGDWVSEKWIHDILHICWRANWHKFLFLTRNPERYASFGIPFNSMCGTTITSKKDLWRVDTMRNVGGFISIEPLLEDVSDFSLKNIRWIINM